MVQPGTYASDPCNWHYIWYCSGFCISYLEIQPFIVTMAGMFFARGMTAVICKEQVSIVSDKIFTTLSSFKISLPLEGI